ncbi:phosphotransferase family protein [Microlunatus parietis]|uniref:Aminoglycoside phosphotransferase (APT) family kinase protein n=1 Tax=Microlunatus parietis TaxID=682979 RepID=A0A7Y9I7Q1_9ACTN|nr:aminoglycoside phosphotransferase family protein [Microlunatus parietis]NYE71829.1 aminoglycoside phosphotransferase (APT) family kinase protein [Microlunatus parietis]
MITDIAAEILRREYGARGPVTVHETWGASIVVERDGLLLKANGDRSTVAEAIIARRVRAAGVPAPEIVGEGVVDRLPGGRWLVMRRLPGVGFDASNASPERLDAVTGQVARLLSILATLSAPGWGWVGDDGRGTSSSWREWLRQQVTESAAKLGPRLSADFVTRAHAAIDEDVPERLPGSILNGDLGLSHVLVDPATGAVTGLLDWAAAIIGDPLFDVAIFSMGGPADDPIHAVLQPRMLAAYPGEIDHRRIRLYRMINHLFNACWSVDNDVPSWTPALCRAAENLAST